MNTTNKLTAVHILVFYYYYNLYFMNRIMTNVGFYFHID